jgi:inner membrane protein
MAFTHPIVMLAFASPFYRPQTSKWIWMWGALLTALPDIDFLGYQAGIPYSEPLGHRGFTHSLLFAAVIALASAAYFKKNWPQSFSTLWLFFFLCCASHGLLDGMTNGGLGVAYFGPFDNSRYFLPWRPIPVAPLSPRRIFSEWGLAVVTHELVWIWIPVLLLTAMVLFFRWRRQSRDSGSVR